MMVCTVTISFFCGLEDVALICNRCRINYRAQCQKGVKEETIIKPCSSTPGTCHLIIHPNSFFCSFREWKTTSQKKAGHPGKPFLLVLTQVAQAHFERSAYFSLFLYSESAKCKSLYEKCNLDALNAIKCKIIHNINSSPCFCVVLIAI